MENGSVAAAKVQIRSNSLQPTTSGNLLAALLDETGALLETQKIGNLSLGAEALQERSVTFSQPGARVVLRYGEAVSDGDSNADAASITLEGLPLTLANFDETDHAELENVEPGSYLLTVVPAADGAAVAVNGKPVENGMTAVKLGFLDRTLTIVVTSPDGSASRTYTLSLKVAPWSLVWYDLTFETNGGSEIPPLRTLAEVTVVLSAYEPTRKGYAFTGWFADAALTQPVTEIKLTGNTTVYAGWKDIRVCPFTDVTSDSYYYEAVLWAAEENIAKGTTPTTFSPNATCTELRPWPSCGGPPAARSPKLPRIPLWTYPPEIISTRLFSGRWKTGSSTARIPPTSAPAPSAHGPRWCASCTVIGTAPAMEPQIPSWMWKRVPITTTPFCGRRKTAWSTAWIPRILTPTEPAHGPRS